MIKDVLISLIERLEHEKEIDFSVTIGGICKETREVIVSKLSIAKWITDSEDSPFPGGYIFPKKSPYQHVSITLYKPEKSKRKEVI